jgi:hypothetical protein
MGLSYFLNCTYLTDTILLLLLLLVVVVVVVVGGGAVAALFSGKTSNLNTDFI